MAVRLFVGNLPYSATEAALRELFSAVAPLSYIYLPIDRETGKPRGFAFVEFGDRSQAEEAIRRFNNQLFMAEAIYGQVDTSRTETQNALGAYVLAQQQINRDYYAGVRLDWTQNPLDDKQEVWAVSPYLSWYWSEFLRFRVEYQHKGGDVKDEDTLYFQCTFIYGAHPPHPYWAMR